MTLCIMDAPSPSTERVPIEPLPTDILSIQPGGGLCMRLELAWGILRRWYLKAFRRGYVERVARTRHGEERRCPHEVLDPRDMKFYRNQGGYYWEAQDDPFAWRDRLLLARVGLGEVVILGGSCLILTIVTAFLFWPVAWIPALAGLFVLWFFRDPVRTVPQGPGLVVAPADGKIVGIEELSFDAFVGGPVVVIGIFLSVFNVHLNRSPLAGCVVGLTYHRGRFLNALRPASARENEQMSVRLEENVPPYRRVIVRQIAGAIARRIVCWVAPGNVLERGERFGMIKLGSRTELVLPREPGLEILVHMGDRVQAGSTIIAQYKGHANG